MTEVTGDSARDSGAKDDTAATTWRDEEKVADYVGRIGRLEARQAGERELVEALPAKVGRVLDTTRADHPGLHMLSRLEDGFS